MKNDKETELRLMVNHNYFIREVVAKVCVYIIISIITFFILGMCGAGEGYTTIAIMIILVLGYIIATIVMASNIIVLHGKISTYEDSIVEDTIHSAIKG